MSILIERPFAECAPGADGYRADHQAAAHVEILDADEGRLDLRGRTAIALCGFAESSRRYVPVDDPKWVLVGLNQLYRHLPRWDVWFDIHSYWREGNLEGTDHEAWLRSCGIPVLMTACEPLVPTSVSYPIARILAKSGLDYFTSTASFMVAWAIDYIDGEVERQTRAMMATEGAWEAARAVAHAYGRYTIGIFGIDLTAGSEFAHQKPCMEFWLGRAAARGIAICVPPESALLKQRYRYGYEREPADGLVRLSELDARGVALDADIQLSMARVERLAGRREEQLLWRQVVETRLRGGTVDPAILDVKE